MPDLEPITRDEKLWSGEDLEPITRREMYIKHLYDETQVIPDKPITREEMFILKAGEELHDVTIEQLTATENRTYSEEGVAYSPVIVNVPQTTLTTLDVTENGTYTAPSGTAYNEVEVDVPLPENTYLLKDIPATPASIATFTDGSALPMPKLEIAVEPQQSGSGDPSPENIRPISGWSAVDVTVADDVDNPTTTKTITIQLGDTYYGGKLDVVSGVLTVDRASVDLGTLSWTRGNNGGGWVNYLIYAPIESMMKGANTISEVYKTTKVSNLNNVENLQIATNTQVAGYIYVRDDSYTSAVDFKIAMNGKKLVYELATPTTIQLTPTQVNSLLGVNNIWADCGDIIDGQYFGKEV